MKPGRCLAEQVGVNAPGTENSTTFLPLNSVVGRDGLGTVGPHARELPFRHRVADFDRHCGRCSFKHVLDMNARLGTTRPRAGPVV